MARLPTVVIVGRPNVGKSTLFNRVLAQRLAIVDGRPGVTRDRIFACAEWSGRRFLLADTGGIVEGGDGTMERAVRSQTLSAVAEADLLVFVVDAKAGPHPLDEALVALLRRSERPVILAVNKLDNLPFDHSHQDFWSLGLGEPLGISALSGKGSGDLLDRVVAELPETDSRSNGGGATGLRLAIVGRPNVGKSSIVNRILGEDRTVVHSAAGTTRDAVDSSFRYCGRPMALVDTAGLRRKAKVDDDLEFYSAIRTQRAVYDSDVCAAVVDATDPLNAQDMRVLRLAWDAGKGLVLLVNKWDLVRKDAMTAPRLERDMRSRAPFLDWVSMVFVSALTGQRVRKVLDLALAAEGERQRRIPTSEVNEVLGALVARRPPPVHRGRSVKIRYATQAVVRPPTFAVFANYPQAVPDHYVRYLRNGFRASWAFTGSPLRVRLRSDRRAPKPSSSA